MPLEHRIRDRLKAQEHTFPLKPVNPCQPHGALGIPVFRRYSFIILADGQVLALNLDEHHQRLLELLGQAYEAFYS